MTEEKKRPESAAPTARPKLSRAARWAVMLSVWAAVLAALLAAAEAVMRWQGYAPWRPHRAWNITVEPGGHVFERDPVLGFRHCPGRYTVTFPSGRSFVTTNDAAGRRITAPDEASAEERPAIWLFGCSFVYGWGLEDDETVGWQLQERFPAYDVVSFGQCGYGTVQALLQLEQALETRRPPALAILTYASFHDARNALLDSWCKGFFYYNTLGPLDQPYGRVSADGELVIHAVQPQYRGWPLMRQSALVHAAQEKWDLLRESWFVHSHDVSRAAVDAFIARCRAADAPVLAAGINIDPKTDAMLAHCRSRGVPAVDIAVNYIYDARYNQLPHDVHPNAVAHQTYAERLMPAVKAALAQPATAP